MMPWALREYVFAAFMTIGLIVSIFVIGPLAPPGMQLVLWAPVGGIFLTLGMAKLQYRGSVALMILPATLLLLFLPFGIFTAPYLAVSAIITEAVTFIRNGYKRKLDRALGNLIFFASSGFLGLLSLVWVVRLFGDKLSSEKLAKIPDLVASKPWILVASALLVGVAGLLGWWLGELVIRQLQRAGKLDLDVYDDRRTEE